jgi:hypothetical protein
MYFSDEDKYLIDLVDEKARRERKSRSAVVLSILEEYFERDKRLGEILVDLGAVSPNVVSKGLELQREQFKDKPLGEILLDHGLVDEDALDRALMIQGRAR